ncbi:hypothetical protein OH77DRAFT_490974 [Trametes cingulata]|nr:hypothetical protein OH77DRAFT_490974 [Trametes cingulata]
MSVRTHLNEFVCYCIAPWCLAIPQAFLVAFEVLPSLSRRMLCGLSLGDIVPQLRSSVSAAERSCEDAA